MLLSSSGSAGSQCPPHILVLPPRHSSFCLSTFAHAAPHPFPSKALLTLQASLETLPPSGTILDPPSPSFNRSPSNTRQKGARCSADRENPTADTEIPIRPAGRSPRASTAQLNKPEEQQRTLWLMAHGSHIPSYQHVILAQGKTAASEDRQSFPAGLPASSPLSLSIAFLTFSRIMGLFDNCKYQVHCDRPRVVNPQSHLMTRGLSRGLNIYICGVGTTSSGKVPHFPTPARPDSGALG